MKAGIKVQHPEWLESACTDTIRALGLIRNGILPPALIGSFIETSALRILRCVHSNDRASIDALVRYVRESEDMNRAVELGSMTDICGTERRDNGECGHSHTCIGSFTEHLEADKPLHECRCGYKWND